MSAHRPSAGLVDRLAAEYVLGTLTGGARRRFERAMREDPAVAAAAHRWQQRLLPLDAATAPVAAGDALWARIEGRVFGGPVHAATGRPWWQRLFGAVPAGALALGLLLGSLAPALWQAQLPPAAGDTQLPESYVGVLATADGKPGLIVSSLRRGQVVDLKRLAPVAVPPGQTLFLWTLDGAGVPAPVGPVSATAFGSVALAQPAEAVFQRAVELAVSVEPAGARPTQPSGAYVYRGLCGKLWPPAAPSSAASR